MCFLNSLNLILILEDMPKFVLFRHFLAHYVVHRLELWPALGLHVIMDAELALLLNESDFSHKLRIRVFTKLTLIQKDLFIRGARSNCNSSPHYAPLLYVCSTSILVCFFSLQTLWNFSHENTFFTRPTFFVYNFRGVIIDSF